MSKTPVSRSDVASNVCCDICDAEMPSEGKSLPFSTLAAGWAASESHDGERYLLYLCQPCFSMILATLKRQRMINTMFDDTEEDLSRFGLLPPGDESEIGKEIL